MKKDAQGFFLLEICIFLIIILLISSIAVPSLFFLNQQVIKSDLEKLNMTFSYMQNNAIAQNKNLILKFENNKSYKYDNKTDNLSKDTQFGFLNVIKGPPSTNQKIVKPINYVNNQVTFFSNGKIQPGSIYLTDNKKYQYALSTPISQVSFIRKYKFENWQWLLI